MQVIELNTDGTVNVYMSDPKEVVIVDHVDDETVAVSMANTYTHMLMGELVTIAVAKFALGREE